MCSYQAQSTGDRILQGKVRCRHQKDRDRLLRDGVSEPSTDRRVYHGKYRPFCQDGSMVEDPPPRRRHRGREIEIEIEM